MALISVFLFLAFQLALAYFLRKSHADDRIEQLWGILARRMANTDFVRNPPAVLGLVPWQSYTASKAQGVGLPRLLEDASGNHVLLTMQREVLKTYQWEVFGCQPMKWLARPGRDVQLIFLEEVIPISLTKACQKYSFPGLTLPCLLV